ncbi:MAG: aldehyde dehydrogenase family protein [Leptospirales bacterium]|nr:aldehyde dehydrogenase family protein [Leptospirales bacterium]
MSAARLLRIVNPASEQLITELECDDSRSIIEKYNRAMAAQLEWSATSLASRQQMVRKFRQLLVDRRELLARTLSEEMGKPIRQARGELESVLGRIDFFVDHVDRVLRGETALSAAEAPDGRTEERITYDPLGVVSCISAWNYPYFVGLNVILPALLTGNTVLYKPSEFAALSGLSIAELLYQSGVPDEVLIPIIGDGFAGQELLKYPTGGVFFTGSYKTGRAIADICSRRFTRLQLELGGKDPVYVCDDVDIAAAAASIADGAFYNTGQSCCSVERIYVQQSIYDRFLEAFCAEVKSYRMGDPLSEETYIGPVARQGQLGVLERQSSDAAALGGRLLQGGKRGAGPGYFFEATVFANCNHQMELMREESFGPIIGLAPVKDDRAAMSLMADSRYGLTASVYSGDGERAQAVLSRLNYGTVYWNCCDRVSPRLPWSGRNDSGMGVTLGLEGIRSFVRPRAWHLRRP